jgi:hypothetical protein
MFAFNRPDLDKIVGVALGSADAQSDHDQKLIKYTAKIFKENYGRILKIYKKYPPWGSGAVIDKDQFLFNQTCKNIDVAIKLLYDYCEQRYTNKNILSYGIIADWVSLIYSGGSEYKPELNSKGKSIVEGWEKFSTK